jgi:hypothetical protein
MDLFEIISSFTFNALINFIATALGFAAIMKGFATIMTGLVGKVGCHNRIIVVRIGLAAIMKNSAAIMTGLADKADYQNRIIVVGSRLLNFRNPFKNSTGPFGNPLVEITGNLLPMHHIPIRIHLNSSI